MASLARPVSGVGAVGATRLSRRLTRGAVHALVILLCAITLFPMLWMLSTSFKIPNEVFTRDIQILPRTPTLSNFPDAFQYFPVAYWFWNSLLIAVVTTAGKLAISIPAAFAFAIGLLSFGWTCLLLTKFSKRSFARQGDWENSYACEPL